jgi:hypothetical protein
MWIFLLIILLIIVTNKESFSCSAKEINNNTCNNKIMPLYKTSFCQHVRPCANCYNTGFDIYTPPNGSKY